MDPQVYITQFKKKAGRLPSQVELSRELGLTPQSAIIALTKSVSGEALKTPIVEASPTPTSAHNWIAYGLFTIAVMTFALSVYFTGLWFTSMFSLLVAGTISVAMVSYMVLSPQAASYVKGIVRVPLWGTFAIALVFSMGSTVAGQYNKLTESVDVTEVTDRALLELLRTQEQELVESIAVDRQQQAFHQQTLEQLSATAEDRMENWSYISTERAKVAELAQQIEEKQARVRQVREQIQQELGRGNIGVTQERSDFYSWLAGLIGIERGKVEFWISALPAVFIDVIAALSLNIALSIRRRSL